MSNYHQPPGHQPRGPYPGKPLPTHHQMPGQMLGTYPRPSTAWFWWVCGGFLGTGIVALILIGVGFLLVLTNTETEMPPMAEASQDVDPADAPSKYRPSEVGMPKPRVSETQTPPDPPEVTFDSDFPQLGIHKDDFRIDINPDPNLQLINSVRSNDKLNVLVGMQIGISDKWNGSIGGFRPLFRSDQEYKWGEWCGSSKLRETEVVQAKPGYVVGALEFNKGLIVNSIRLKFIRLKESGQLDLTDSYWSESVGGTGGFGRTDQQFFGIGTGVRFAADADNIKAIGLEVYLPLPTPESSLPKLTVSNVDRHSFVGDPGNAETDIAPEGGVLVGLRIFEGKHWNGAPGAIQAIYQIEDKYVAGQPLGQPDPEGELTELFAPSGQVVGEIKFHEGIALHGIQLAYHKLADDGKLGLSTSNSLWIGHDHGRSAELIAEQYPISGIDLIQNTGIKTFGIHTGIVKLAE